MKKATTTNDASSKPDRKTIEKNRRIHMKALCFKLASLIPSKHLKPSKISNTDRLALQDQLDLAARYIKHLTERIEKLKGRKEQAIRSNQTSSSKLHNIGSKLPVLELRDLGSTIEVMLVSGLIKTFMFYEVISVLEEEGAEVVTASVSNVGDKIFYIVHAQVKISRVGVDTTRVHQRLMELIAPLESWEFML